MKKILLFAIFLMGLGSITAQSFLKELRTGYKEVHRLQATDTLKILAVMVEFQEDKYDATVGNGKFGSIYTQDYGDTIIDPLPHDAGYFSDHMEFAKNYYKKVSNGKVNITYKVLPEVLTVSKYMRDYIPEYNSDDFTPLGNFTKEVWELADKKFTNVKFSNYDLFIIFHAGVSAGIDLGYFNIDRNLPSVYISPATLKKIFGNQFNGFPVENNSAFISNSILMAETESRENTDIEGNVYVDQISINGFLVNNIASYLGLPDLFNTETGRSAIGRFGLMDSQGLNAFWGMFPPEPSPWEKMYLGWEQPVTVSLEDKRVNISTRLAAVFGDTTLLKIPINSSEYFLVENRSQDARKDFVKITYKRSGNIYTKIVHPDSIGVYYVHPDSINGGVVIDVDEFDAAVPGNGLVIWHIDENIVNQNIADNKINAGEVKGIYVVEADGIEDIGQLFYSIFGQQVIGEGSYEDFWYKGNRARLYKNRFSSNTKPNTNSNTGANSLITIDSFSELSNKMGFNIKWGNGTVKLISKLPIGIGKTDRLITSSNFSDNTNILILENSDLYIYDLKGVLIKKINSFSNIQPVSFEYNSTEYIIGAKDNSINIFSKNSGNEYLKSVACDGNVTAISVDIRQTEPYLLIGVWIPGSYIHLIPLNEILNLSRLDKRAFVLYNDESPIINFGVGQSFYNILGEQSFVEYSNAPSKIQLDGKAIKSIMTRNSSGNYISVILMDGNRFIIYEYSKGTSQFYIDSKISINSFTVADILNNGQQYIVFALGNKLVAYSLNGVMADYFPFILNTGENFVGTPLIAEIESGGKIEIIAFTDKGNIYVIDPITAKVISPYPISFGEKLAATPILINKPLPVAGSNKIYEPYLALITDNNDLYIWQLGVLAGKSYWAGEFGDSYNSSYVESNKRNDAESEFFPAEKAYNWPNPVYGNETNIRCFVAENSQVNIKIFDLAGDLVDELQYRAVGGFDNETKWDVSHIQSGIYYARLEVISDTGKSASKIIKIAVIK